MSTKRKSELLEVFAGTAWQAEMVRSLLENAEIGAFVKDEIMGTFFPWWTAPGGAGSVTVFVSIADYDRAKEIVRGYETNIHK
jgi:hypothetical protein